MSRLSDKSFHAQNKPRKTTKLRGRHKLFVTEYLKECNGTKAATAVGYKSPMVEASRLLRKANVQEELAHRMDKLEIKAEAILSGIAGSVRRSEEAGNEFAALKGYELLGKHLKLFTERIEVEAIHIHLLSDDELERRLGEAITKALPQAQSEPQTTAIVHISAAEQAN